jgi:hypothetical protein
MSSQERSELLGGLGSKAASVRVWIGTWSLCILLPAVIQSVWGHRDVSRVFVFGTALIAGIAVIERIWRAWKKRFKLPSAYQEDLEEGKVEVLHVRATDVAEIEEVEDLGLNFFLDVGDSQLLFLTGQYLYELAHHIGEDEVKRPGTFPNRQLEIVRAPRSRRLLGVACHGEPLRPSSAYRIPKGETRFFDLEDGQVLAGTLSTLQDDLKKLGIRIAPSLPS